MEDFKTLASQVALVMGEGWSVDRSWPHDGAKIRNANGAAFWIRPTERRTATHVTISPEYPDSTAYDFPNAENRERINVAAERGEVVIVREIRRRLMPSYLETLPKVRAADEKRAGNRAAQAARIAEVHKILGTAPMPHMPDDRIRLPSTSAPGCGTVHISHDGSCISIETGLMPAGMALAILRMLVSKG